MNFPYYELVGVFLVLVFLQTVAHYVETIVVVEQCVVVVDETDVSETHLKALHDVGVFQLFHRV